MWKMLEWEVVWQLLVAVTLLLSELIGSKGETRVQQLFDGEKCYLRPLKGCLVTVRGSVRCIAWGWLSAETHACIAASGSSEGAAEEVSRGRCTWSQVCFARSSCVKSLQHTCKVWMQLHMPSKASACVSKRESLTRDLNSCLILKKKKKINTVLPIIMCTAGNFLIYLFHSQIPSLFPSLYSCFSV